MTLLTDSWLDASTIWIGVGGMRIDHVNASMSVADIIGQRSRAQLLATDTGLLTTPTGTLLQIYRGGGLNLLTANQSNIETDTSGWQAQGGGTITFTRETSTVYDGIASLSVVTDGTQAGQGVVAYVGSSAYMPNGTYTVSAWVKGPANATINISLRSTVTGTVGSFATYTMTGNWQRISQVCVLPSSLSGSYGVFVRTNGNQAITFYVDDVQIEQDTLPSPWKVGGTTGDVLYDGYIADAQRARYGMNALYGTKLTGMDQHYLADKRVAIAAFSSRTCGYMVRNLIDNYLAQEGVTYTRGINTLSAAQSAASDATQFGTNASATWSVDTTTAPALSGSSLKVVTNSVANQGVYAQTGITRLTPGGSVTFSVYMKASSGTPLLNIWVWSSSGQIGAYGTCALTTAWQRFTLTVAIPNPITQTFFQFGTDSRSAGAITYWMSNLQAEVSAASAWVPGATGVNILDAEQADVESSTLGSDFAALGTGCTIAQDITTPAWNGTGSLKGTFDGTSAHQGFRAPVSAAQVAANMAYALSVYVLGTPGQVVRLFLRDDVATTALTPTQVITLSSLWTRYTIFVTLPSVLNGGTYSLAIDDNGTNTAKTCNVDGLQWEQVIASNWELGGAVATIQEGVLVGNYNLPGVPISTGFDDFAQYSGYLWYIDYGKVMWFYAPGTVAAPFTFDGSQGEFGSGTLENSSPLYRNGQWLLNVPDVTELQTETRKGDGTTRAFTLSYPVDTISSITLNGTAQSFGQKGVDDVNHSDHWYANKGDTVLAQDTNDTILTSTDTLIVRYVGQWVSDIYTSSPAQVAAQQVIEGGGTSGIVEEAHQDNTIVGSAQAFQLGSALLARYGVQGQQFTFSTRWKGLAKGQLLTVNIPSAGWQLQNRTFLIEQVTSSQKGPWMWYDITAISGPFNSNWVQFYQWIAGAGKVAGNAGGANQVSRQAQVFTAAWNWTASFTATVYTCPIVGPSLLCGPSVKVC